MKKDTLATLPYDNNPDLLSILHSDVSIILNCLIFTYFYCTAACLSFNTKIIVIL